MRKRVKGKKFSRSVGHRKALRKNLLEGMILHGRIQTTLPKAKYLRPVVEKIVTKAREDTPAARRLLRSRIYSTEAVNKLFTDIAPKFADRPGGYTRIVKLGPRQGDAVEMAIIEFVE